jgi:CelD/BcsL family acetyltransferase involved in cellulose biosynthesis
MFSIDRESARGAANAETRPSLSIVDTTAAELFSDTGDSLALSIISKPEPIAREWKDLQDRAPVSPYQAYDLVTLWVRHAAEAAGVAPRIGVLRNLAGSVVAILPFGLVRRLGTTIGVYLGGSHFNVNLPLVDPALPLGPGAVTHILDAYCAATGADLLHLNHQPVAWRGVEHPFLCLPHQDAPDDVSLILVPNGDYPRYVATSLARKARSELRRKAAKFAEAGARAVRAETPDDVERFIDAFLAQKAKRLASQGVDDPFATPGIKEFFSAAALRGLGQTGGMELHALQAADGHLLAVRAGARHQDQYSLMVQSFDTADYLAKYSPSECLIAEVLAENCRHGVTAFDFGVGANRFKKVWSNGLAKLFNLNHAVNAKGQLHAGMLQLAGAARRYVKRNPRLFSAVQDARALSARLRGRAD